MSHLALARLDVKVTIKDRDWGARVASSILFWDVQGGQFEFCAGSWICLVTWNWVSPNWPSLSGKEFDALNEGKHWQLMSGMFLPQLILMAAPTARHMGPREQGSVKGSDTRHSYPCWHFPENCQDYFLQVIFCEWLGNIFGFRWNSLHFFPPDLHSSNRQFASFVTYSGLRYRLCKNVMLALVLLCSIRLMTY